MIHTVSKSLKRRVRSLLDRSPRAVILAYHRVAADPWDPSQLCVSPRHFEEQMHLLREETEPIRLRDLALGSPERNIRNGGVVLTFDDGYADSWSSAAPVLAAMRIPATFFVTTGMVDSGREFLADELIHLTLLAARLPKPLEIAVRGLAVRLAEIMQPALFGGKDQLEGGGKATDEMARERLYAALHRILREENSESREAILSEIRRQVGGGDVSACESHRTLSSSELRELAGEDLFEVAAHSIEHLVLRRLPVEEQARQIRDSKCQLERILSRPVESFAYPYGSEWNVSPTTVDLVRQAGFRQACANVPGQIRRDSNPFWLPRCLVRDWGEAEFRQKLRDFFLPHHVAQPVSA